MYKTTGRNSRGVAVVLLVIMAMVATLAPGDVAQASEPDPYGNYPSSSESSEPAPVLPAVRMAACALETTVSTATELDDAITCYNTQMPAGSHTITFGASFSHPGAAPTITQADPATSLTIQGVAGQNHTITGPGQGASTSLFRAESGTLVVFDQLTIANAGLHGIEAQSAALVTVRNSTLVGNFAGAVAFAGAIEVINSTSTSNVDGVVIVTSARAVVSNSTVTGNSARGVFSADTAPDSQGLMVVANSTVTNNPVGAETFNDVSVVLLSSVLDNPIDCDGPVTSLANNFSSTATCDEHGFVWQPPLPLAANGGPTMTQELPQLSNAIGGGECTNTIVGFNPVTGVFAGGALSNDQRGPGFPRTIGAKCDAGAFEASLLSTFTDVSASGFYADAATWAAANAITTGTGDGTTFTPNGIVTRAQIATFLWRASGRPAPAGTNPFTDVPPGKFFTDAVVWLAENNITSGTGDGTTFSPNAPVNRAQIATFLWRFAGEPTPTGSNNFTDVPPGKFFTIPVVWLAETGITTGTGDGTTFSPNSPVTRAQAVTFLLRFAQRERPSAAGMHARNAIGPLPG